MSDTNLLPCPNPWCRSALDPFVASMSLLGTPVFRAECGSCGINCGELTRTEEDAAATWNTRVPDPRLDAAQSLADALTLIMSYVNRTADSYWKPSYAKAIAKADETLAAWEKLK